MKNEDLIEKNKELRIKTCIENIRNPELMKNKNDIKTKEQKKKEIYDKMKKAGDVIVKSIQIGTNSFIDWEETKQMYTKYGVKYNVNNNIMVTVHMKL